MEDALHDSTVMLKNSKSIITIITEYKYSVWLHFSLTAKFAMQINFIID